MNFFLWILQLVLAAFFAFVGGLKTFTAMPEIVETLPWAADVPVWVVRLAGSSELLGAIGLILPALVRIKPVLTPVASGALGLVMAMAAVFHLVRGEYGNIVVNIVALALAAFVAYGRFKIAPIEGK